MQYFNTFLIIACARYVLKCVRINLVVRLIKTEKCSIQLTSILLFCCLLIYRAADVSKLISSLLIGFSLVLFDFIHNSHSFSKYKNIAAFILTK